MPMREFRRELNAKMKEYNVDSAFARRYLNDGFSGGEKKRTFLMITHYQRMLNYVKPDFISIFYGGRIVKTGGPEIAEILEEKGYGWVEEEFGEKKSQ